MNAEQIREIVKITLDELIQRKLVDTKPYVPILQTVEKRLIDFFNNRGEGNGISYALPQLSDDPYIDIIYLQYRDKKTLEWIAEAMERDISTIKRNKKRLIKKISEILEELKND